MPKTLNKQKRNFKKTKELNIQPNEVKLNDFPTEREDEEGIHAKLSRGQIGIRVDPFKM
jgi:hypothetical protein